MNKRATIALFTTFLLGGTLIAGQAIATGDQTDPLITLSYLEETITPALEQEAKAQAEFYAEEYAAKFQEDLSQLEADFQESSGGSNVSHQYQLVSLHQNQSLTLDLGTQVVLRMGTATATGTSPVLMNLTSGVAVGSGDDLEIHHLYLATSSGGKITAQGGTVQLLVYGDYSTG